MGTIHQDSVTFNWSFSSLSFEPCSLGSRSFCTKGLYNPHLTDSHIMEDGVRWLAYTTTLKVHATLGLLGRSRLQSKLTFIGVAQSLFVPCGLPK